MLNVSNMISQVINYISSLSPSTLFLIFFVMWKRKWLWIVYQTFGRDFAALLRFVKLKMFLSRLTKRNETLPRIFRDVVNLHPNKVAILWEDESWTFKQLDQYSNQVANLLLNSGFKRGDEISLFMESRPEYIGIWLGAAKAGIVTALINTNLRQKSLLHSITVINSKALIFGSDLKNEILDILPLLEQSKRLHYFCFGSDEDEIVKIEQIPNGSLANTGSLINTSSLANTGSLINTSSLANTGSLINTSSLANTGSLINGSINNNLNGGSNNNIDQPRDEVKISSLSGKLMNESNYYPKSKMKGNFTDRLFYVYTSGTTGLPKAAIIKHCRYFYVGSGANVILRLGSDQVLYTAIPLYHMAGGAVGTSQCLIHGCTIVIRSRFSASNFWTDCIRYKCTAAQYIGEICRYLLTQPSRPTDRGHNVRIMFGNGLRGNIWDDFKNRFGISTIAEFYGATEGNASVVNTSGKSGACGFVCQILPTKLVNMIYPVGVIKVNEETGEVIRDPETGLCITCGPGDTGEFVGKIVKEDPTRAFDGYVNKEASEKKVYRDVYVKGDAVFASGDLLTIDDLGYVYFKDRTGDTFRWKGENVSTTEIESLLQQTVQLSDCVVYGVTVPGCEGKAGMAAIADPDRILDLEHLLATMKKSLPFYAIPIIIRVVDKIETTGTFKLPKVTLQKEGYDISVIKDPLYFLDFKAGKYLQLDQNLYEDILNGQIRF